MNVSAVLARSERDDRVTARFRPPRTEQPQAGIVVFPRQETPRDTIVDKVPRLIGLIEPPKRTPLADLLQFDRQIAKLRQTQEEHAEAIGRRLGLAEKNAIGASKDARTVRKMVRRLEETTIPKLQAEVSMHSNVLADLSQGVRLGLAEHQDQINAVAGQVHGYSGQVRVLALRVGGQEQALLFHREGLEAHEARLRNIEQFLAPRPTAKSGFDWKLQGAWIGLIAGAAILAARFFNLL